MKGNCYHMKTPNVVIGILANKQADRHLPQFGD